MALAVEKSRLVSEHLGLVHAIARKVGASLKVNIEYEDLVGYGSKGLVEAAARFDSKHGVTFATFAYYRIRGAMFDGLRSMGGYTRADHTRFRAHEAANEYLASHATREAAPAGRPAATGDALEAIGELLSGIAAIHLTALEGASKVADPEPPADVQLHADRMGARVRRALEKLPARERKLMDLYYFAGKNLEEAGKAMCLSKSWACRVHAKAIDLLKTELSDAR